MMFVLDTWLLFLLTIFSSNLFGLTGRDQIAIKLENISNLIRDTYLSIERGTEKKTTVNINYIFVILHNIKHYTIMEETCFCFCAS